MLHRDRFKYTSYICFMKYTKKNEEKTQSTEIGENFVKSSMATEKVFSIKLIHKYISRVIVVVC